jgi:hypothetical protein
MEVEDTGPPFDPLAWCRDNPAPLELPPEQIGGADSVWSWG